MNKLAVNLSADLVDNQYFKFLVIPQAVVVKILRHRFAVRDRLGVRFKLDADAVSKWNAVFHIEKELLHDEVSDMWWTLDQAGAGRLRRP
jgi:hypothetical protein